MKKIYLLFVAATLAACSAEPVENEVSGLDANLQGKQIKAQGNHKEAFDIPVLTLGEGTTEDELQIIVTAGESGAKGGFRLRWMTAEDYAINGWGDSEELDMQMCQAQFQVTGNDQSFFLPANGDFTFNLSEFVEGVEESCDRSVSCGLSYVFKVQALNQSGQNGLQKSEWSQIYSFSTLNCPVMECESGYMIGDKDFSKIGKSNNWGWAHQFNFTSSGSETREIHHKNGTLGGEVTITYNNGIATISEGEGVTITHLYLSDVEPTETNAPGQFDKTQEFEDADGSFWVIIKAEVCK
ncbi:hypothetical protein HC174_14810 [Salinimicrobium sp. CDJ15-81-2]|nr:hypothetical protein [Salinimicrobium nanhaiense]